MLWIGIIVFLFYVHAQWTRLFLVQSTEIYYTQSIRGNLNKGIML